MIIGGTVHEAMKHFNYKEAKPSTFDENYKPDESEIPPDVIFTINDFIMYCEKGCYNDYDGIGEFATETTKSGIMVSPSEIVIKEFSIPKSATHVIWYNK